MEANDRAKEFLEGSFLKEYLFKKGVTDITYNGESFFYVDNERGRRKASISAGPEDVAAFLRQIANLCEKQFSYMNPILDVSFSRYRLNATFSSICRVLDRKAYSFALRIGYEGSAVNENASFFPGNSKKLLLEALARGDSIVIAGETGSGKTELQKYLLLHMKENTRVIVIDNVEELELSRGGSDIDLTSWRIDSRFAEASFSALIKNALRNNPDYILVAEARGDEMYDALRCAMSGHPIITTLPAKDVTAVPFRMARLAMVDPKMNFRDLLGDVYRHFETIVYLRKSEDGSLIERSVLQIARLNPKKMKMEIVFDAEANP